jgi:hypothetical protein
MNFMFFWSMGLRHFHGTKKATFAHIRDIPSDSEDSELCDEDVGNNCLGIIQEP